MPTDPGPHLPARPDSVSAGRAVRTSGALRVLMAVLVLSTGWTAALQSRVNGSLSVESGSPILTALWSFGSAWLVVTCGFLAPSVRRAGAEVYRAWREGRIAWWQFGGGAIGAVYVAIQAVVVPSLGVALFLISVVAGQTVGALLVDRFGIGSVGPRPLSWARVAWAALAVGGAAVAMSGRLGEIDHPIALIVPVLASVVIGGFVSAQGALNGQVKQESGNFWFAAWVNFTWGTLLIVVIALVTLRGVPDLTQVAGAPWWAYIGGLLGIWFVVMGAIAVKPLGSLVLMLLVIAGQLSGALALDGINPATRALVTPTLVIGVLVTMVAAMGASMPSRPSRPSRPDRTRTSG